MSVLQLNTSMGDRFLCGATKYRQTSRVRHTEFGPGFKFLPSVGYVGTNRIRILGPFEPPFPPSSAEYA